MAPRHDIARRTASKALDWMFVPRCSGCETLWPSKEPFCHVCEATLVEVAGVCPTCSRPSADGSPCSVCRAHPPAYSRLVAPYWYGGELAVALRKLKFCARTDISRALRSLLAEHAMALVKDTDAVLPVPLHWRRQLRRGFNQADLLAGDMADGRLRRRWLRRIRSTRPQTELPAGERRANVGRAFAATRTGRQHLGGKRVLLVDDVVTTGATADAAARAILDAGAAHVVVFAAARVEL